MRTATALSAITKNPCRIFNIRKGREKPGLSPQHLLGLQALAQLCNGNIEGGLLGSEEIIFEPQEIKAKDLHIKIDTAGSITLALQTLIPAALHANDVVKITFDGGATNTFFSPTINHFQYVFLKILEKMGVKTEINVIKEGYYPEGRANVEIKIWPSKLKPLDLTERGDFKKITVISGASESLKEKKVAERQIAGVREILGKLKLPTEEKIEYHQSETTGSQICLLAEFENTVISADGLGKLGKAAEEVGRETAMELLKEQKSGACLDKHLADQILPYMALSQGKSEITVSEVTDHCKTNIWVIEKFLNGKFKIKDNLISWQ